MTGHGKSDEMIVSGEGPWNDFVKTLEGLGCSIVSERQCLQIDGIISNNSSYNILKVAKEFNVNKSKMVCILWEPQIVDPRRFSPRNLQKYGTIFSPSSLWIKGPNVNYFNWPQVDIKKIDPNFSGWDKRKNKSVMIAANKYSVNSGELYSLRRSLAVFTALNKSMDLYGYGWNKGFYYDLKLVIASSLKSKIHTLKVNSITKIGKFQPAYIGPVQDKIKKLQEYRINVVIENSPDYISEKLFDSIASGAITIYVGPELQAFGLPDDIALTVKPNKIEISNMINRLIELPMDKQKKIAQKQWESLLPYADLWQGSNSLTSLARSIHSHLAQ